MPQLPQGLGFPRLLPAHGTGFVEQPSRRADQSLGGSQLLRHSFDVPSLRQPHRQGPSPAARRLGLGNRLFDPHAHVIPDWVPQAFK